MPEYLAPGVYIEEVSFRAKSIEGVSTTTTGFIGPARYGPVDIEPDIITGLGEFERVYGDRQQLKFKKVEGSTSVDAEPMHNYLWHAVRAFFESGGKRLYISRVFRPISATDEGYAKAWLPDNPANLAARADRIRIRARFPGEAGKMRVRLTLRLGQNVLSGVPDASVQGGVRTTVGPLAHGDVVWINDLAGSPPSPIEKEQRSGDFYIARYDEEQGTWGFESPEAGSSGSPPSTIALDALTPDPDPRVSDEIRVVTLTLTAMSISETDVPPGVWDGLALDPQHKRAGSPDSVFSKFGAHPTSKSDARRLPVVVELGRDSNNQTNLTDGVSILKVLFQSGSGLKTALNKLRSKDVDRSIDFVLTGGNDGQRPTAAEYEGTEDDTTSIKTGLKLFEDIEDISIVAAPGSTFDYETDDYRTDASTILNHLISHAERMRYRIAVLDSGDDQAIADVRAMRARLDSKYAAFYYPWIRVLDPVTQTEIYLPPSGFIAGIYARNDVERAVFKAPANEVVGLAIGLEQPINKAQQEVLNPEGINCIRFFEGRGFRVWGARTTSSDPEWKYVNLRRYFAYLERSIDRGTQWAVFEPNGDALWANVRQTIQDFLFNEWVTGALLGEKPEKAYFVRCDRSTMTQNDLDNGRLVCLIGVAVVRPAEFVIFRIGQWTSDRKG